MCSLSKPPKQTARLDAREHFTCLGLGLLLVLSPLAMLVNMAAFTEAPPTAASPQQVPWTFLTVKDGRMHRAGETHSFTGTVVEYFPDSGRMRSRSEVVNGVLQGVSEGWHSNGVLQVREHFVAGASHGLRTKWHANGKLQSTAEIVGGKLHGTFRSWNEEGVRAEELELEAGVPNGIAKAYHPSGQLKSMVRLKHGKAIEQTNWPESQTRETSVTVLLK